MLQATLGSRNIFRVLVSPETTTGAAAKHGSRRRDAAAPAVLEQLRHPLGRRQPAQLRGSFTQSKLFAIRTLAQHGVKRIRYGNDLYRQ